MGRERKVGRLPAGPALRAGSRRRLSFSLAPSDGERVEVRGLPPLAVFLKPALGRSPIMIGGSCVADSRRADKLVAKLEAAYGYWMARRAASFQIVAVMKVRA